MDSPLFAEAGDLFQKVGMHLGKDDFSYIMEDSTHIGIIEQVFLSFEVPRQVVGVESRLVGVIPEPLHLLIEDLLSTIRVEEVLESPQANQLDRFNDIVHPLWKHELGGIDHLQ